MTQKVHKLVEKDKHVNFHFLPSKYLLFWLEISLLWEQQTPWAPLLGLHKPKLEVEQNSFRVFNFSHLSPRYKHNKHFNFLSTPALFGALDLQSCKFKVTWGPWLPLCLAAHHNSKSLCGWRHTLSSISLCGWRHTLSSIIPCHIKIFLTYILIKTVLLAESKTISCT